MTDQPEENVTDLATKPETEVAVMVKIDAELLGEARRQISAPSPDAAITEALRRLVDQERAKRDAARARLRKMYDDGELDFGPLEELDQ